MLRIDIDGPQQSIRIPTENRAKSGFRYAKCRLIVLLVLFLGLLAVYGTAGIDPLSAENTHRWTVVSSLDATNSSSVHTANWVNDILDLLDDLEDADDLENDNDGEDGDDGKGGDDGGE